MYNECPSVRIKNCVFKYNLYKTIKMYIHKRIRLKLLKQLMVQINMRVAASTKSKTHYETLGIRPNATHNEIKSAYYKLTLKYHPDKNKSESAKHMFQEISNAYTVLGNYQTRKQYDRTVAVRHGKVNVVYKPVYRPNNVAQSESPKYKVYDFDEWTRQHYQQTFESDMRKKWIKEHFAKAKHEQPRPKEGSQLLVVVIFIGFCLSIYFKPKEDYDRPLEKETK
ncbi:chaperone protein DnaJ-like [Osmia bicornis bicornis]|uniref:chaperone protein DnaJ-like n=1 Tax=Osmia bicornis bicornis TaxID=1437191 RepID=UPI0010F76168|nr:chaperone protein DnaJ-like [Osmia bicornis bicornis]XP_029043771.1 chaperone protein DnaJ-like [Osmia bicornis bicornis]XP_029043779.1 chaperone protein DnaJ-like [Osmia bicornis bicornis]